jgi:hypothetical protein
MKGFHRWLLFCRVLGADDFKSIPAQRLGIISAYTCWRDGLIWIFLDFWFNPLPGCLFLPERT